MTTEISHEFEQFRKTFFEECSEILSDLDGRLEQLQSGSAAEDNLGAIFRAVHSIKAGAGVFSYIELVQFTHVFENLLDHMRDGRILPDDRVIHALIRAGDVLSALVAAAQENEAVEPGYGSDVANTLQAILNCSEQPDNKAVSSSGEMADEVPPMPDSMQGIRRYKIEFRPYAELFRHANEPLLIIRELKRLGQLSAICDQTRLPSLSEIEPEEAYLAWLFELRSKHSQKDILEAFEFVDQDCDLSIEEIAVVNEMEDTAPIEEIKTISEEEQDEPADQSAYLHYTSGNSIGMSASAANQQQKSPRSTVSSIRVDIARIDRLVNMAGELVIAQAMLAQQIADRCPEAETGKPGIQGHEDLATLTRELQECVMAIRMQPVKSVFARMPRLIRDIASKLGKSVRLVTSGEQTEVDKTIIEELADPLTHIIRNAVDHGIEHPNIRRMNGKPEEGRIELSASHVGSNILIQITDDGAGIDRERLLQKAISRGVISPDTTLNDNEIEELIFAPGLSTTDLVTDVSGRGVGMDVVRRNITNLGGRIQVQSVRGQGTRFTLVIPLTLAVLDGMVIAVGNQRYILPLTSIVESFRPAPKQIRSLNDGQVGS